MSLSFNRKVSFFQHSDLFPTVWAKECSLESLCHSLAFPLITPAWEWVEWGWCHDMYPHTLTRVVSEDNHLWAKIAMWSHKVCAQKSDFTLQVSGAAGNRCGWNQLGVTDNFKIPVYLASYTRYNTFLVTQRIIVMLIHKSNPRATKRTLA